MLVERRLSLIAGTKLLKTNFTGLQLEPSVRLLWTPTSRQSAWVSFTRALRTPSRVERDFFLSGYISTTDDGTPFFARFNANRNFESEQLNGYELGYRRLIGKKLYVDVAAFFNQYDNLFSQEITGSPFLETRPPRRIYYFPRSSVMGFLARPQEWRLPGMATNGILEAARILLAREY